jgi:peptide/nickel transport system permease protein
MFFKKAFLSLDNKISYFSFLLFTLIYLIFFIKKIKLNKTEKNIPSKWDMIFRKLKKNKNAMFGLFIITLMIYIVILAPFLATHSPIDVDWSALSQGPSKNHFFGTDEFGRDLFTRILFGSRVIMGVGVLAVIINSIIGTTLGLIAGYYGGTIDNIIMRVVEIWNSIPFILLAIVLMAAFGTGILNLIIVVSLTGIMGFVRIIRSTVMQIKEKEYILAAKVMAIPTRYIITKHILPNCIGPIIVLSTLRIGDIILTVAGLSFLGLGIQPPTPSWGKMLASGQQYLSINIWMSIIPGICILLVVFGFNLFGDGLRDAFDAKLKD